MTRVHQSVDLYLILLCFFFSCWNWNKNVHVQVASVIYWEAHSSYQVFWQIVFLYIICMYLLFKACLNFVCITCVPHLLLYSFYVVAVVVEACLPLPLLMKMRSLSHCQLMNNVQVHEHVVGKLMYTCTYCTFDYNKVMRNQ